MNWAEAFTSICGVCLFLTFIAFGITKCSDNSKITKEKRLECLATGKSVIECSTLIRD